MMGTLDGQLPDWPNAWLLWMKLLQQTHFIRALVQDKASAWQAVQGRQAHAAEFNA